MLELEARRVMIQQMSNVFNFITLHNIVEPFDQQNLLTVGRIIYLLDVLVYAFKMHHISRKCLVMHVC
jgi:hypothetical protein